MSTDASTRSQAQSLLSSSPSSSQSSGAGSTIPQQTLTKSSTPAPPDPAACDSVADPHFGHEGGHATAATAGGHGEHHVAQRADDHSDSDYTQQQVPLEQTREEMEATLEPVNGQIELLEHGQEGVIEEGQEWVPEGDHEMKRVKVYELIGARWVDQGTAFCFGQVQEDTCEALLIARSERDFNNVILSTTIRSNDVYQRQQDTLIVWTEPDGVDYALSFQDPEGCADIWNFILEVQRHMNNADDQSAVSSSPQIGPEPASVTNIIRSGHLPRPQMGIIGDIEKAIKALTRTQALKERICEYIVQEEYIKQLVEVMNTAEDLENLEELHALCSLMQTILMLNDHGMYEHILEDDIFFGVVGMLEYDPDFPTHKANYREFLHQTSQFHQPIPIHDASIQRKIHHTYRLQFLKDVVLARALDDSTFNVLNSCILFNQIDIINHVEHDPIFLRDIVGLFVDEEMLAGGANKKLPLASQTQTQSQQGGPVVISLNGHDDELERAPDANAMDVDVSQTSPKLPNGSMFPVNGHMSPNPPGNYAFAPPDGLSEDDIVLRREVVTLVQQLCVMGKNVQLPARMALFRTLVDRGVLFVVQWALDLPEKEEASKTMLSAGGEILVALLDHDLNGVRGHVLKQIVAIDKEREAKKRGADKAETILQMACRMLAYSKDTAVQCQIGEALKSWLEIPREIPQADTSGLSAGSEASAGMSLAKAAAHRKDDPGTERFMDYFYKDCLGVLFKPLNDLPEWKFATGPIYPLTREETNRFVYLCDLLYNFISQHHFRCHFYLMSSNILARVATLLRAKDKHLRHASFRIYRLLLKQNNANIHAQVMKHDILKPILDLTIQESRRDNLLSCSCQEYFESMRRDNIKDLIRFCMTKHEEEVRTLARSPLGGPRFEGLIRRWEMNNEPPPPETKPEKPFDIRTWPQPRSLDAEEEDYFNADDEDEFVPIINQQWNRANSPNPQNALKRKRRASIGNGTKGHRPPLRTPSLGSLVDYGEEEEEGSLPSTPHAGQKRTQTSHEQSSDNAPPSTPVLTHRRATSSTEPPVRASKEDEEDDLLESLVTRGHSRPQSPAPGMFASMDSLRSSEKRRRGLDDDDDDDEMMERLTKSKKFDFGPQKEKGGFGAMGRTKNGDDPPRKMKLKFGTGSLAVASTPLTTAPSETGTKDGDTG